jgi:hypothetical protein
LNPPRQTVDSILKPAFGCDNAPGTVEKGDVVVIQQCGNRLPSGIHHNIDGECKESCLKPIFAAVIISQRTLSRAGCGSKDLGENEEETMVGEPRDSNGVGFGECHTARWFLPPQGQRK